MKRNVDHLIHLKIAFLLGTFVFLCGCNTLESQADRICDELAVASKNLNAALAAGDVSGAADAAEKAALLENELEGVLNQMSPSRRARWEKKMLDAEFGY
ncbi:MAG: hypothetical protein VYA84_16690 [Planctomycetota bacterium]|nr:hypothetical protein [Planctomycetota bacterium]